jgi:hypothetical protein
VGLFARLSTAKATRDLTELSFDRQHERSAAFCEAKAWNVVKLYQDLGPAHRKPGMANAPHCDDIER